jgi:hypothetical protein
MEDLTSRLPTLQPPAGRSPQASMSERVKSLPALTLPRQEERPEQAQTVTPGDRQPPGGDNRMTPVPAPASGRMFQIKEDLPRSAYEDMPFTEVLPRAASNFFPSAGNVGKGLYDAVVNYEDTAGALNQLGKGVISKVRGALGGERNMEAEAVADALGSMYADRYGSMAAFKETLAEDPASIGLDVASVAPVVGPAGRAAGLGPVATGLQRVTSLGDPVNLAAQGVKLASRGVTAPVTTVGRYVQGAASGVTPNALKLAEQAGKSADPAARAAFKTFAMGKGDNREIARTAVAALDERRAAEQAAYVRGKRELTTQELSLNRVQDTVNQVRSEINRLGLSSQSPKVAVLEEMARKVDQYVNHPDPTARTAVQLDVLKRDLRDMMDTLKPSDKGALSSIPTSVRDTIATVDPGYAAMMERYQSWLSEMKDIQSTLGANDRVAETTRIARLLSTLKSDDKTSLLKELAGKTEAGKYLPYMIAGASVEKIAPPYLQGMGLMGAGSVLLGGPHGMAMAAAGSPRLAGFTQYGAGRLQGAINRIPTPPSAATNLLSQIGNERMERKTGGRVGMPHDKVADQLVMAAERAKKGISKGTESLLDMSDNHIAHALEVANRSI